ncbi:hypothetical protein ES708_27482 [subsurface metagenome]
MTKEEILAMEVGKALDALMAEKVMGHPMPDFIPEDALDLHVSAAMMKVILLNGFPTPTPQTARLLGRWWRNSGI